MKPSKHDIITFKVDESLHRAMNGIPNRSEFIRAAILAALENACPLCNGTGILTPNQRDHWDSFAHTHSLEECGHCHERRIVCLNRSAKAPAKRGNGRTAGKRAGKRE